MLYYRILRRIKETYYVYFKGYKDVSKKRDPFIDIFDGEEEKSKEIKKNILKCRKTKALWPEGNTVAFNLQFDDFSTKHKGNSEYDYGGDPNSYVCKKFKTLFIKYPYLKTTIFTIPNPKFIKNNMYNHKFYDEERFKITNNKNKEWLYWIKSKDFQKNCEIAAHGLYHCQYDIKTILPFLEFEFKNRKECDDALDESCKIFRRAGINISGFKPPSWGIGYNSNFGLIESLKTKKFNYVCISSPVSGLNWQKKQVSNFFPQYYDGLLNIPQNINMLWSWEKIKKVIDFAIKTNGIIVPQLHFIKEGNWMDDGIGERSLKRVDQIIKYLQEKCEGNIWFATANEISDWWKKNGF